MIIWNYKDLGVFPINLRAHPSEGVSGKDFEVKLIQIGTEKEISNLVWTG